MATKPGLGVDGLGEAGYRIKTVGDDLVIAGAARRNDLWRMPFWSNSVVAGGPSAKAPCRALCDLRGEHSVLAQDCVDLFELLGTGAKGFLGEVPKGGGGGVHGFVDFFRVFFDKEESGEHLVFGFVVLHEGEG